MRTSGFKYALYQRHIVHGFFNTVMRHSALPHITIKRKCVHLQPVAQTSANICCNSSLHRLRNSPNQCHVLPFCCFIKELTSKICFRIRSFGHDQQTGSILVYAVNQPHSRVIYVIVRNIAHMPRQSIYKCSRIVSVAGMYNHSSRFVYHKHHRILINNIDRYVLCYYFKFITWPVHYNTDNIQRLNPVVRLYRLAIHQNAPCIGSLLYPVS